MEEVWEPWCGRLRKQARELEEVAEQGSDFMEVVNGTFCSCSEFSLVCCCPGCRAGGSALLLCWRYKSKGREVNPSLGWALNLFSVFWGHRYAPDQILPPLQWLNENKKRISYSMTASRILFLLIVLAAMKLYSVSVLENSINLCYILDIFIMINFLK